MNRLLSTFAVASIALLAPLVAHAEETHLSFDSGFVVLDYDDETNEGTLTVGDYTYDAIEGCTAGNGTFWTGTDIASGSRVTLIFRPDHGGWTLSEYRINRDGAWEHAGYTRLELDR